MKNKLYKSGTRVIYLFDRTCNNNKDRKHLKWVTRNENHFDEVLSRVIKLKEFEMSEYPDKDYRIYSSLNSRNLEKAIKQFKIVQLENDYTEDKNLHNSFYLDLWNRWISTLSRDENRESKLFMFDCDTEEEVAFCDQFFSTREDLLLDVYSTKKGMHYITAPFNFNEMNREEGYKDFLFKDGLISTEFALKEV